MQLVIWLGLALPEFCGYANIAAGIYCAVVVGFRLVTNEATLSNDVLMTRLAAAAVLSTACCYAAPPIAVMLLMWPSVLIAVLMYVYCVRGAEPTFVDMKGKVAIVTGANTGIGLETARGLAEMGAHVILACRTAARTKPAVVDIIKTTRNRRVEFMPLDLSSFESVRAFAKAYKEKHQGGLHVLVNNAGCMMPDRKNSEDGIELMMQSNHLGHFLLTELLLAELRKVDGGRVVNVASALHHIPAKLDLDGMKSPKHYSMFGVYSQTKLANVLFTFELQRRLEGTNVTANCAHPGNVLTDVTRNLPSWLHTLHTRVTFYTSVTYMKTAQMGAFTSLHLATSPQLRGDGGKYYVHCAPQAPSKAALDRVAAAKLWQKSCELVGISNNEGDK